MKVLKKASLILLKSFLNLSRTSDFTSAFCSTLRDFNKIINSMEVSFGSKMKVIRYIDLIIDTFQ